MSANSRVRGRNLTVAAGGGDLRMRGAAQDHGVLAWLVVVPLSLADLLEPARPVQCPCGGVALPHLEVHRRAAASLDHLEQVIEQCATYPCSPRGLRDREVPQLSLIGELPGDAVSDHLVTAL